MWNLVHQNQSLKHFKTASSASDRIQLKPSHMLCHKSSDLSELFDMAVILMSLLIQHSHILLFLSAFLPALAATAVILILTH